jgi:ESF2/ABP1 family protein
MRAELDQSAKQNKVFVSNVEKGKMLEGIHAKAAAKAKKTAPEDAEVSAQTQTETTKDRRRIFTQVPLAKKRKAEDGQSEQVQRVLSKIF